MAKALDPDQSRLLVVAVHSPSCRHCASLLTNLETAALQLSQYFKSLNTNTISVPLLAKLDATLLDSKLLQSELDVTSFPTILIIKGTREDALLPDWFGSTETASDLFQTILHYWYRWNYDNGENNNEDAVVRVKDDLNTFLEIHAAGAIRHLPPSLNPNLSLEEQSHIEWLLSEEDEDQDPYVL